MRILMTVFFCTTIVSAFGCAKGRYTDDHHYIGNPERLPATTEPATVPSGAGPSGVRGLPPSDPSRP